MSASPTPPLPLPLPGDLLSQLLDGVVPLIRHYLNNNTTDSQAKVIDFTPARQLVKLMPTLTNPHTSMDELQKTVSLILHYSTATHHPLFLDKLYSSCDAIGHVAELLTSVLNTNTHVFACAPLFVMMERQLISLLAMKIGYSHSDGLLCPGGSYSNLMSLLVARHLHFPHVRISGWREEDKPVLFVSASAHYSISKAANCLGMGMNAVRAVKVDQQGRMDPQHLQTLITQCRERGERPFYVCATAGTTVLGAFDPINDIADVMDRDHKHQQQQHNNNDSKKIYLHVDGSCQNTTKRR